MVGSQTVLSILDEAAALLTGSTLAQIQETSDAD